MLLKLSQTCSRSLVVGIILIKQVTHVQVFVFFFFLFNGSGLFLDLGGGGGCGDLGGSGVGGGGLQVFELLECGTGSQSEGNAGLEGRLQHNWDGKGIWKSSTGGNGLEQADSTLEFFNKLIEVHIEGILVEDDSIKIDKFEFQSILERNNVQQFAHLGGTFTDLLSLLDNGNGL